MQTTKSQQSKLSISNKSDNNYLSFLEDWSQPQKIVIRSNEYFSIISQQVNDGSSSLKVKLQGLLNPEFNILQVYNILNPFEIYQNTLTKSQIKYLQEPKSRKVRDFMNQLKRNNPSKTSQQDEFFPSKSDGNTDFTFEYSLFFLYYIKKLYNSTWRRNSNTYHLISQIQNLQIKLIFAFYKLYRIFMIDQKIYRLFSVLQFERYPINQKQQQYHIMMQQFLLYKLYTSHGIKSKWSEKYQRQLNKIGIQEFSILIQLQKRIQLSTIKPKQIRKVIAQKILNPYLSISTEQQQVFQIVSFLIGNLYDYQLPQCFTQRSNSEMMSLFGLSVKQNNKVQQSDSIQILYRQLIKDSTATKFIDSEYHTTRLHFTYTEHSYYKPIKLSHIVQSQKVVFNNSSQEMFGKLVPLIVVDYYVRFGLFDRKEKTSVKNYRFQEKKYFLQVSSKTLVWREDLQTVEVDKMKVWKLLFGMQYHPMTLQMAIANISQYQPSIKNIITKTIRQMIRDQLYPIIFSGSNKKEQTNKHSKYLFLFPFVHLLVLAYQLFEQKCVDRFVKQCDVKNGQQNKRQQNIAINSLQKYSNQLIVTLLKYKQNLVDMGIQLTLFQQKKQQQK